MSNNRYERTVRIDDRVGVIVVRRDPAAATPSLTLEVSEPLSAVVDAITPRVTGLFDLSMDPDAVDEHLAINGLSASVQRARGVRVPGAFDAFELALRAILGQQVTVKGATTLMSRLTAAFGERLDTNDSTLGYLTPTARCLAAASVGDIAAIGVPTARAATLLELARRVANGAFVLESRTDASSLIAELRTIPGVGPWTAEYIAMRAAHWSDAFPATDIALRRAAGGVSANELRRVAERWRPWRAYAAMRLWLSGTLDAEGAPK